MSDKPQSWVMSDIWMRHVWHRNESCPMYEWGICLTYVWLMTHEHVWICVTYDSRTWLTNSMCDLWLMNTYEYVFISRVRWLTNTYEWVFVSHKSHIWMSHESLLRQTYKPFIYEWLMTHRTRFTLIRQTWMYEWFINLVWCMNESCPTYKWVMSRMWTSPVPHTNESCPMYEWVIGLTYEWFMTHSYVWQDLVVCVIWLIICAIWLIHTMWLIHTCDMTHSYVWHD